MSLSYDKLCECLRNYYNDIIVLDMACWDMFNDYAEILRRRRVGDNFIIVVDRRSLARLPPSVAEVLGRLKLHAAKLYRRKEVVVEKTVADQIILRAIEMERVETRIRRFEVSINITRDDVKAIIERVKNKPVRKVTSLYIDRAIWDEFRKTLIDLGLSERDAHLVIEYLLLVFIDRAKSILEENGEKR